MKQQDLKYPFKWQERKVLLQDQILYVPNYLEDYAAASLPSWQTLFASSHPIHVEYCSGNGSWIVEKALKHPEINWIAVELKFERVRKIWSKIKNYSLSNCFIICGEAKCATTYYLPADSVESAYINFPDPWPKKRHWKHRLLQSAFFDEIYRVLKPQGNFTFVTDDVDYSDVVIEEMLQQPHFTPTFSHPYYQTEMEGYGISYFETLWRSKGKQIRYHQWNK